MPVISSAPANKSASTTTYSQCSWDATEGQDTGFVYTSAREITTKMASRQCILIKGTGQPEVPFTVDDPDFCMDINQDSYEVKQLNNCLM